MMANLMVEMLWYKPHLRLAEQWPVAKDYHPGVPQHPNDLPRPPGKNYDGEDHRETFE
jgi:hypothetical protein